MVVAPDAGASRFVTTIGRELGLNAKIASKYRPRPEVAPLHGVLGDFTGKRVAIVLGDMISSGGTVYALAQERTKKGIEEVYMGASDNLCLPEVEERLQELIENNGLKEVMVTNTIPQAEDFLKLPGFRVEDIAPVFSQVIHQIYYNRLVDELLLRIL